jgi:hypothetical protein
MLDKENVSVVPLPTVVRVLMPNGQVEEMKLETYLAGIVATEMDASAPLEALKAQAVASRTYAATAHRHPERDADLCTTSHCQRWKRVDPVVAPEVYRALSETWGMVAVFNAKPIDAFFFEHCDGHTRNSDDMLMPMVPYLRSVECSCGFLTLKGHGVGLCKRGALVMARRGASFEQILRHYYRGISIVSTPRENHAAPEAVRAPAVRAPKSKARSRKKTEPARKRAARPPRTSPRAKTRAPAVKPPSPRRPRASAKGKLRQAVAGEVVQKIETAESQDKARRVHVDHLPGQRMIAGSLPRAGLPVTIEDAYGNKIFVLSGSSEQYGEGGFEALVGEDGNYSVTIDGQVVPVQVQGETVFIHMN